MTDLPSLGDVYLQSLLEKHQRKYKLVPMLRTLSR